MSSDLYNLDNNSSFGANLSTTIYLPLNIFFDNFDTFLLNFCFKSAITISLLSTSKVYSNLPQPTELSIFIDNLTPPLSNVIIIFLDMFLLHAY